ncbi:Nitronate monooxygenase [Hypsizygus marmoreus]|uniref:Nitronate monooxygenase n=1 Tax=Hypsizygus marmoreus TaxID=39966 RepID=A0A369JTG5_HYPMA|nr:Nitronate monooxygenase [Hypsizygus marmoreus]
MQQIKTPLTKLLNVKIPIVSAPMAIPGIVDIGAAVTSAGAFGFIGAGFLSSENIKLNFEVVRQKLQLSRGDPVPIGIGFIGWVLDKTECSDDPRINATLDEKPMAIWFAFGVDLGKYIAQVRAYDAEREHKTVIFVIVNSVQEALKAANEWKVDVLVAQGIEAGGHGGSASPPLLTLLEAIIQAISNGPLIVAAGGISTGSQIAALLTMGVAGVVLGTRFLFSEECKHPQAKKDVLLHADLHSTVRSLAFDEVGRTMGWPPGQDGRAVANQIIQDVQDGLDLEERLKKFDESAAAGETSRLIVWAGVGAGLVNKIAPISDIISELHEGMLEALKSAPRLIETDA